MGWVWKTKGESENARREFATAYNSTLASRVRAEANMGIRSLPPPESEIAPRMKGNEAPSAAPGNFSIAPSQTIATRGESWIIHDPFRDEKGDRETITTYTFLPSGTGTFTFAWLSGHTDKLPFEFHMDGPIVLFEFANWPTETWPAQKRIRGPETAQANPTEACDVYVHRILQRYGARNVRLIWSVTDDGKRLTLDGKDIR